MRRRAPRAGAAPDHPFLTTLHPPTRIRGGNPIFGVAESRFRCRATIRGAILSVPKGQLDSARAVGMSNMQAMRHVIFPQMLGYFLPPATNQAVLLVKESSVTSTITVVEMTMAAQIVQGNTFSPVEVFLVISVLYWTLCSSISRLGARLEIKLQPFARGRHASRPARLELAPPAER